MVSVQLLAHELMCFVLAYTVFYRAVRMDCRVRLGVRLSFWLLGAVACLGIPWPFALGFKPGPYSLLLLTTIVVVQLVTSRYWCRGVPYSFYKPDLAPKRRAEDQLEVPHGNP